MDGKIYGLIGRSLKHSYSVLIHRELGNRDYRLIELEPAELPRFLRRPELGGLNVTIPYKQAVIDCCDRLSPEAKAIGSVNTLVRQADSSLIGYNTDAYGLIYLARRTGLGFSGQKTVIFGSGGASLTAQAVAKQLGAREVIVVSRQGADNYHNLHCHYDAELLINATPVGMYPDAGSLVADPAPFVHCTGVLDLVYNPRRTALLLRAEQLGIPCGDGLPMLVAQAKAAEELFTGRAIPEAENERILGLIRRQTENIVLIGMPGSGKSMIGRALASLSGRQALNLDELIERQSGTTIAAIFRERGEAEFRRLEREAIAQAGAERGCIIITGGGAVKDERNYAPLHQNGRIYHIEREPDLLSREGRPLSMAADLQAMYAERLPLYQRFRDQVIENNGTPEQAAHRIWRDFNENTGD